MIVEFKANKGRRNLVPHQIPNARFHKGKFRTGDKQVISKLINSVEYERGYIDVVTPMEHVNDYLEGKQPDKFTKEILDKVSPEGLMELADHYSLRGHKNLPTVIKTMLKGRYVDNLAVEILEEFETDEELEDLYEVAYEQGVIERSGPWYKFSPEDRAISRDEAKAKIWVEENKAKVQEEIAKAKASEEAETE